MNFTRRKIWQAIIALPFLSVLSQKSVLSQVVVNEPVLDVYPEGTHESLPVALVGDCFGPVTFLDITQHTDPRISITIETYLSGDGGQTWDFGGSATRVGGLGINPISGNPETQAGFWSAVSNPTYDKNNKFTGYTPKWKDPLIKTNIKVTGGTLATKIVPDCIKSLPTPVNVPDLHHSIAVVQSVSAAGTFVASVTTAGITTTTGNLVIIDNQYSIATGGAVDTDNGTSNVWTTSVAEFSAVANVTFTFGKYNANINGKAGHTFTLTMSGSGYPTLTVTEVSGHAASPLDKTATCTDTTGTTHTTGSTGALSQAAELAIGCGSAFGVSTLSVSAPWTQLQNISHDGTREGIISAYQIVAATTALTFTWATANSVIAPGYITTWKEASGGVTPAHKLPLLGAG